MNSSSSSSEELSVTLLIIEDDAVAVAAYGSGRLETAPWLLLLFEFDDLDRKKLNRALRLAVSKLRASAMTPLGPVLASDRIVVGRKYFERMSDEAFRPLLIFLLFLRLPVLSSSSVR